MKKFRYLLLTVIILAAVAVFVSCNSAEDSYYGNSSPEIGGDVGDSVGGTGDYEDTDDSKIIKNASVNAETKDFENAKSQLKALISSVGGNIANSNSTEGTSYYNSNRTSKRANYTIKIPSGEFDTFLEGLEAFLNVTYITTSTEDVTESYLSLEGKIAALESQHAALTEMLSSVDLKNDFYTWQQVKAELTEVESQLNYYTNMLKNLDKAVTYSTVYLTIEEVVELTVETEEKTYLQEIGDAFKNSFNATVKFFKWLLIVLIYLLPFTVISGAVAIAVVLIVKRVMKKKAKQKADEAAKMSAAMQQMPPMMPPQYPTNGQFNDPNIKK